MTEREPIEFNAADHRWQVEPGHAEFVREVLAPLARHPEQLPAAQVVKENRLRTVARVAGPEGFLFCKRFRVVKPLDRWLHLLKPSPARREWLAMRRLRSAGLPCPEPVVFGEERRGWFLIGSVLATREATDALELNDHLDALRQANGETRKSLVTRLAEVIWRVFQAGGDHPDLHLGNFLARDDGSLVLLDLHSLRLKGGLLGVALRRKRLGKLAWSFNPTHPDSAALARDEIAWFAGAYSALDPALGPADALREWMLRQAGRLEEVRLRSRGKRCLVNSTLFVVERQRGKRIYRRRAMSREAVLEALGAEPLATIHAHPKGRSVIETIPAPAGFDAAGPVLIRKRYLFPSLRKRIAGAWNPLPLRAWKAARACEVREVPVPTAYACVIEGRPFPRHAAILMDLLADVTMIHVLLLGDPLPAPASRRRLARDFGALMGRFHGSGLKSRDLAVQNILIRPKAGSDGRDGWDLWLVDLDEVKPGAMSRKEKLRALVHMGDLPETATRTDRLRFWKAYLDAGARAVLAPELEAWGERGLGQRVGEGLRQRAEAKARRQAKKVKQPQPTDLSALKQ